MKKITTIIMLALCVLAQSIFAQDQIFLPSYRALGSVQITKFHKITGHSALYEISQSTGGTVYKQTKTTSDTASVIVFTDSIVEFAGSTFSDSIVVLDTTESFLKVYLYADSLGATLIDSTPYMRMTYDPIVSYTLIPIVDGYVNEVVIDPGNARCSVVKQMALDSTFQGVFPYSNDTILTFGVTLTLRDTNPCGAAVNFCDRVLIKQLLPWNNQTLQMSDCGTTLSNGGPNINWYGSPTSDDHSVHFGTVEERYGVVSNRRIYIKNMVTNHIDSIITNLPAGAPGQVIAFGDQQGLPSNTQFMLYGNLENVNGISYLTPVYVYTLPLAPVLTLTIDTINVAMYVNCDFEYVNNPNHTCNITIGYGISASMLMYVTTYANNANTGSLTSSFPLPPTTGQYIMRLDGYDEQTITLAPTDTQSFIVSSLTGLHDIGWTHPFSLMTKISVYDMNGKEIYTEVGEKLVPRLRPEKVRPWTPYIVVAFNKEGIPVYRGKLSFH